VSQTDRLRIAVFIDFDNIEIGVRSTLNASFDAGLVLEALKERGEVVSKMAYSDWQRAGHYSRALTQHAIRMVQRNLTPGGDKNGADINLALDALEMAFTHPHINAFVIVGGDSDFISLVEKLKQYDKQVFVVGGRQFTSGILQRNCHEFIAYEHLVGAGSPAPAGARRQAGREARGSRPAVEQIEQAVPLVTRALKVLSERDVSPQLGLLKTTLLQLDSTFSERTYGAGSFRDFAQKLEKAGVLKLSQGKGGWLVAPADGAAAESVQPAEEAPESANPADRPAAAEDAERTEPSQPQRRPVRVAGTPADGVREFAQLLASAQIRRWPLYLRNVKQAIRQSGTAFDERAYGFATLTDLLRAAHREGIVRVDRDRQGVVRVFQGTLPSASAEQAAPIVEPAMERLDELAPDAVREAAFEPVDDQVSEVETPSPIAMTKEAEPEDAMAAPPRRRRARASGGKIRAPQAAKPRRQPKRQTQVS
jgi:uncharacterized LabA/DUF88 family protein